MIDGEYLKEKGTYTIYHVILSELLVQLELRETEYFSNTGDRLGTSRQWLHIW